MGVRRGTIAVFSSSILRNIISFIAIAYFSRDLGLAALGSFFLFQSILSMLSIPVDLGLRIGIEKRISEGKPANDTLATGLVLKSGLLIVSLLTVYLLRDWLNSYIGADVALLLGIALILSEIGKIGQFTLRGEQRVAESAIYQPLRTSIWALAGVILVYLGFREVALFWGYLIGLFVAMGVSIILMDTKLGTPSLSRAGSLFGYSKFAVVGMVGGLVYNWTDVLLIGYFISQTAVGAYEIAWKVATVSLLLSNAVQTSIFPQANALGADKNFERLEDLIERSFIPSFYLVIPAAIGGAIIGDDILSIFFSVDYPLIHIALVLLFIEKLQRAFITPLVPPMHAIGHVNYAAYTTLIGLVVNLIANITLIPMYGVVGAAIGTTLGGFASAAPHTWLLTRELDIGFPWRSLGWLSGCGIIMGIAVQIASNILQPINIYRLVVIITGAAVIYGLLSISYRPIRNEIWKIAKSFL